MTDRLSLNSRVVVITGGGGLLGRQHAEAIAEVGGIPVLFDIDGARAQHQRDEIERLFGAKCLSFEGDVTKEDDVNDLAKKLIEKYGYVDVLINNAALNPNFNDMCPERFSRLENYALDNWNGDLAVGLTGAFLCSKIFGACMLKQGRGVIVNISSDLGLIGPDQRLYRQEGVKDDEQPVKPVTYSVIKHGLIGLTRYLATYWGRSWDTNKCSLSGWSKK